MSIIDLCFYKVLKNEDADPLAIKFPEGNKGLLVVADGLGGSGCFVHNFPEEEHNGKKNGKTFRERIVSSVLASQNGLSDEVAKWLKALIEPMADEHSDTSALWGSRVVIARFVSYMSENPDVDLTSKEKRQEIVDYIVEGINGLAKEFGLDEVVLPLAGQSILPTTLVAIRYKVNDDETVTAEVVWAGDSRAYALLPGEGLKQLSEDDEDASGAINNLFSLKRGNSTILNYRAFKLPAKSAVFVCSDGFFDPYDPINNVGVECDFLEALEKSDSFEGLKTNWYEKFVPTKHDDCSAAFAAFGFESVYELRDAYLPRYETLIKVFNKYYNWKRVISIVKGEEEKPEGYIIERSMDRRRRITDMIVSEMLHNPASEDAVIIDELKRLKPDEEERRKENRSRNIAEGKKKICNEIMARLSDPENKEIDNIFKEDVKEVAPLRKSREKFVECQKEFKKAESESLKAEEDLNGLLARGNELRDALKKRKEELEGLQQKLERAFNLIDDGYSKVGVKQGERELTTKELKNAIKNNKLVIETISSLIEIFNKKEDPSSNKSNIELLAKKTRYWDDKEGIGRAFTVVFKLIRKKHFLFYHADKKSISDLVNFLQSYDSVKLKYDSKEKEMRIRQKQCEDQKTKYQEALSVFCTEKLPALLDDPKNNLRKKACDEYNLPLGGKDEAVTDDEYVELINSYLSDDENYMKIIRLVMYSDKPTVIDNIFNTAKLNLCRTYKAVDEEDVKQFIIELEDVLAKSEDISEIQIKSE